LSRQTVIRVTARNWVWVEDCIGFVPSTSYRVLPDAFRLWQSREERWDRLAQAQGEPAKVNREGGSR